MDITQGLAGPSTGLTESPQNDEQSAEALLEIYMHMKLKNNASGERIVANQRAELGGLIRRVIDNPLDINETQWKGSHDTLNE